jgi:hypothetical protein
MTETLWQNETSIPFKGMVGIDLMLIISPWVHPWTPRQLCFWISSCQLSLKQNEPCAKKINTVHFYS